MVPDRRCPLSHHPIGDHCSQRFAEVVSFFKCPPYHGHFPDLVFIDDALFSQSHIEEWRGMPLGEDEMVGLGAVDFPQDVLPNLFGVLLQLSIQRIGWSYLFCFFFYIQTNFLHKVLHCRKLHWQGFLVCFDELIESFHFLFGSFECCCGGISEHLVIKVVFQCFVRIFPYRIGS